VTGFAAFVTQTSSSPILSPMLAELVFSQLVRRLGALIEEVVFLIQG